MIETTDSLLREIRDEMRGLRPDVREVIRHEQGRTRRVGIALILVVTIFFASTSYDSYSTARGRCRNSNDARAVNVASWSATFTYLEQLGHKTLTAAQARELDGEIADLKAAQAPAYAPQKC